MVLGFRGAKDIGIYGVFCSESVNKRENTTYVTIFRDTQECENKMCCNNSNSNSNNNSNSNSNNKQQQQQQQQQQPQPQQSQPQPATTTITATATATTPATRTRTRRRRKSKKKHKHATKSCVTSCGMKRTSCCALHLRARRAHEQHQRHTTIHNPYGIAGVRSSTSINYTATKGVFCSTPQPKELA